MISGNYGMENLSNIPTLMVEHRMFVHREGKYQEHG